MIDAMFESMSEPPQVAGPAKVTDVDLDKAEKLFHISETLVLDTIDKRIKDPDQKRDVINAIFKGKPHDTITKVFELADKIKVDELKKNDSTFNPQSAFIRGVDDTVTFGAGSAVVDAMADTQERARLLKKAFPKSTIAGEMAGFIPLMLVNPFVGAARAAGKKIGAKEVIRMGGAGVFELGAQARPLLGKLAEALIAKRGEKTLFAAALERAATSRNIIAKAADLAVGGSAFEVAKESVAIADDAASGRPVGDIAERLTKKGKEGAIGGAIFGAGFEAVGAAARGAKRITGWAFEKGARTVGGLDTKYVVDHLDTINRVLETSPESVIAMEAKTIEAGARKFEGKLATREERLRAVINEHTATFKTKVAKAEEAMKLDLLAQNAKRKGDLEKALEGTGVSFQREIEALGKAEAGQVAGAARDLYESVQSGFRGIGKVYREQMNEAVTKSMARGVNPRIETAPVIDKIETFLKRNKAMDGGHRPLEGSIFAQEHPAVFNSLVDTWRNLGGETVASGGAAGTMAIDEALTIKRAVGEVANFGKRATMEEAAYRDVFFSLKTETEKALPELAPINKTFATNRGKLDDFRTVIGDNEIRIARFLESAERDRGSRILINETFRAVGEVSADLALRVKQALPLRERLNILGQFPRNPRSVVNEMRRAYLNQDAVLLGKLETIADEYPKLRPYLQKAKDQAEMIATLSDAQAITRAVKDVDFEARLAAQRPDLTKEVAGLKEIADQRTAFREAFPNKPKALEQRLISRQFGQTGAEQAQIKELTATAPEAVPALETTQVARDVKGVMEGNITRNVVEDFNLFGIGDTIFKFRSRLTPRAFRFVVKMKSASPQTRKAISQAIVEEMPGTQTFTKEQLTQVVRAVGAERAILMYGQNGGQEQIERAIERVAADFEDEREDDNGKRTGE